MRARVEIEIGGVPDACEADFAPPPPDAGEWHPAHHALATAAAMAAELVGGEGAAAGSLGIEAVPDAPIGPDWSCQFGGQILRGGQPIGTFTARTVCQFG